MLFIVWYSFLLSNNGHSFKIINNCIFCMNFNVIFYLYYSEKRFDFISSTLLDFSLLCTTFSGFSLCTVLFLTVCTAQIELCKGYIVTDYDELMMQLLCWTVQDVLNAMDTHESYAMLLHKDLTSLFFYLSAISLMGYNLMVYISDLIL